MLFISSEEKQQNVKQAKMRTRKLEQNTHKPMTNIRTIKNTKVRTFKNGIQQQQPTANNRINK